MHAYSAFKFGHMIRVLPLEEKVSKVRPALGGEALGDASQRYAKSLTWSRGASCRVPVLTSGDAKSSCSRRGRLTTGLRAEDDGSGQWADVA